MVGIAQRRWRKTNDDAAVAAAAAALMKRKSPPAARDVHAPSRNLSKYLKQACEFA